jgi:RNA polymerase sigma-70 factor (ECF subfamily)
MHAQALRALELGEADEARRLCGSARSADPSIATSIEWAPLLSEGRWSDAWLIAAVRRETVDVRALDVLVARHWQALHARCVLLTLDREKARDLAQETWVRVLRARRRLETGGNLPAYLATIATNVWRDRHRTARRARQLADDRLGSLDAVIAGHEGDPVRLGDAIADERSIGTDDQAALRLDLDRALGRLSPRARDVLIARFVDGESAAEIGVRYGRTEQTITSWLRQTIKDMQRFLHDHSPSQA